jgi:hypothetical protein
VRTASRRHDGANDSGDYSGLAGREQVLALARKRNADLKALLTTEADRAKFEDNVKNSPAPRSPGGWVNDFHELEGG